MTDTWTPPDAPRARAEREYAALFRIHQRHANDPGRRDRGRHPAIIGPAEAVRLLVGLAAGSIVAEDGEDAVDAADLTAALTLMPMVRAEVDQFEASLLMIARGQGMTWQQLAFGLGLGSAQAARQRYERLALRAAPDHAPASPHHDELRHISRDIVYGLIRTRQPRSIQIGRLRRISRQWIAQCDVARHRDTVNPRQVRGVSFGAGWLADRACSVVFHRYQRARKFR